MQQNNQIILTCHHWHLLSNVTLHQMQVCLYKYYLNIIYY